jgi:cell division protein FtsI (penicillin-binding protein 3)
VHGPEWNKRANSMLDVIDTIAPQRGNLLSSDGSILACNLMVWDISIDLRHKKITDMNTLPWAEIDSLADLLDEYYPRKKNFASLPKDSADKYSWHAKFRRELNEKPKEKWTHALMLAKGVTTEDFDRIGSFPFIKRFYKKKNTPYYKKSRMVRRQPYGSMAHYSIGMVFQDPLRNNEWHGYSGLEKDLDSLLYGKPGLAKRITLTRGTGNLMITPPVKGYDVVTTIDIGIQDILEQEMLSMCEEAGAYWGTAMIMEVETGEIKAISNIELLKDGTYGEAYNRIVECYEPGSVIKPVTLMIAFEDGLIKSVNDVVDTSPFQQTKDPHAPTIKNIKQVMAWSSNTGVARILFRGYADRPEAYFDRLASIGFNERFHTGIAEEQIPRIRRLVAKTKSGQPITMTARHLDLARQGFGYTMDIPPLYTLSIYNAIANNGKFVRPHLVRALRDENGKDSIVKHPPVREQVCSPKTASMLRECLLEVVWGEGTGRRVRDDRVKIAGKTGTVIPYENGRYEKSKRRLAFAGFFPYDNPKYSCIVLMKTDAGRGAAGVSGGVLKNVALKMYARGMFNNQSTYTDDRNDYSPTFFAGNHNESALCENLKIKKAKKVRTPDSAANGVIPDVTGYDARTAVATLENLGYNVILKGSGLVVEQSLPKGTRAKRGQKITLTLKN